MTITAAMLIAATGRYVIISSATLPLTLNVFTIWVLNISCGSAFLSWVKNPRIGTDLRI